MPIIACFLLLGCIGTAAWWLTMRSDLAPSLGPIVSSRQAPMPMEAAEWHQYATRAKQMERLQSELLDNLEELQNRSMVGGDLDRYQFAAECEQWLKTEVNVPEEICEDFIRALRVELQAGK